MREIKKYYAFFDVDGTVVKMKSMLNFLKYFYLHQDKVLGRLKYFLYGIGTDVYEKIGINREWLNKRYYKKFKGYHKDFVRDLGESWFLYEKKSSNNLYIKNILDEINKHKKNSAEIVFVSGSFDPCLKPLANQLGVKIILATTLEIENGLYTGKILRPQAIGEGKAHLIKTFLNNKSDCDSRSCFAYGDHYSDIPMLQSIGNPYVVAGDKKLETHALLHNWKIIYPN
jgi:HAD superfamily hydrolase (TIGR01490 family)